MIEIEGVQAKGEFEVFDSGGGWVILFGKLMLQTFKATHKYETGTIIITDQYKKVTIHNQIMNMPNEEVSLMLDNKQWRNTMRGGIEMLPSRQVLTTLSSNGT